MSKTHYATFHEWGEAAKYRSLCGRFIFAEKHSSKPTCAVCAARLAAREAK